MPRTLPVSDELRAVIDRQDGVVSTQQLARAGFSVRTVNKRIERGTWQRSLPGVVLSTTGEPTRRQRLMAAWLWAGVQSAIDGIDALRWHGVDTSIAADAPVHVVVPWTAPVRSRDFVIVRRAMAEIGVGGWGLVPYVDAGTAAVVAARNARSSREAIAKLARTLQQGVVSLRELEQAREAIGDKWCRQVDGALLAVGVGVRSPAEEDLRGLVATSRRLPPPRWNQWLDLGDGGSTVCVDALWREAAVVQEVIGKRYHAWGEQYDETNARKERLQAVGLFVCEATPTRIRCDGPTLLRNLEQVHARYDGRGMPAGVHLIPPPGIAQ